MNAAPVGHTVAKHGEDVVTVTQINLDGSRDLLHLRDVSSLLGGLFCLSKDGEENGCQDRDDGDDNKKFDKGKGTLEHCAERKKTLSPLKHLLHNGGKDKAIKNGLN